MWIEDENTENTNEELVGKQSKQNWSKYEKKGRMSPCSMADEVSREMGRYINKRRAGNQNLKQ